MDVSSTPSEDSTVTSESTDSLTREFGKKNNNHKNTFTAPKRISRFYSTPLNPNCPDSTPVRLYGCERREPSVIKVKTGFLNRLTSALEEIKEDLSSRAWKSKRVTVTSSSTSDLTESRTPSEPSTRPLSMASMLSLDMLFAPARKPNRRFSTLGFGLHSIRDKRPRSVHMRRNSHPNPSSPSTNRDEEEVR
ncbi:hypothetical protein M432DRAFT_13628 [Thermoascus aurantiacus ATCC 26904]